MKDLGPDERMQQSQKAKYSNPEFLCSSGAGKAQFVCFNPTCTRASLHCPDCKECQYHLSNSCQLIRLKGLTQMFNQQMEGKKELLDQMINIDAAMFQKISLSKQNLFKIQALTYLQKKQIQILEALFAKKSKKISIAGRDMVGVIQKMKRARQFIATRQENVLKLYKHKIDKITQQLLQLDKTIMQMYLGEKHCSLDSRIVAADAFMDQEFIFQSFSVSERPKRLELIFRASENDFLASKLHQKCGYRQHTFTLIKTQFGKILAGYHPFKFKDSR